MSPIDHIDPLETPDAGTRNILERGGPLQIALRGYEVAKWNGSEWESVVKFRPSEKGRLVAIGHAKWLTEREADRAALYRVAPVEYRVRVIVSLEPPQEPEAANG